MTAIYRTTGHLTGHIEDKNVQFAQEYLTQDDMTQYLDESIAPAIARVEWSLHADGHNYHVEAIAHRELTDDELRVLSEWVSGQNSDGLGEGFEQQPFAEIAPSYEEDDWGMISFDWETNKSTFTRVV